MRFFRRRKKGVSAEAGLPRHIAIIMDGNGRWAQRRGLPRSAGHAAGAEVFKKIVSFCGDLGIGYLTAYAFSTENWKRPEKEVESLQRLLLTHLKKAKTDLAGKNVRVRAIGDFSAFPPSLIREIEKLETDTQIYDGLTVNLALGYGGREEIARAARLAAREGEEISEETLSKYMYTAGQPDPDLIIRPSGELRISNFMLWQSAYAEFWFSNVLWPDFTKEHLLKAIEAYKTRNRRFGGI